MYLRFVHHVSYRRLSRLLLELFGLEISEGALLRLRARLVPPAPPMLLLFGAAAATLVGRRRQKQKKDD